MQNETYTYLNESLFSPLYQIFGQIIHIDTISEYIYFIAQWVLLYEVCWAIWGIELEAYL